MNKLVSAAHDATHLVPGVPAHSDAPARHDHRTHTGARRPSRGPRLQNSNRHHQAPPRILVAWQGWIGRRVARRSRDEA